MDGVLGGFAQIGLQLRERLFDRVEVRAVGREELQFGAGGFDGLADSGTFVD